MFLDGKDTPACFIELAEAGQAKAIKIANALLTLGMDASYCHWLSKTPRKRRHHVVSG
jgi:hypothetical protein